MGSRPTVSIGLPVYNGARFLADALDSILAQTYSEFDLVISDNASTDDTEALCREYARRDSRVRYLREDVNRGATWNYNKVFHETAGALFKWAAHDDVLAPAYLYRCVEEFGSSPHASVVYPSTKWLDENGDVTGELHRDIDLRQPRPYSRLAAFVRSFEYGNAAFGLMRRTALDQTRLLGAFPSADFVMLAELAIAGEIRRLPEALFFRRDHPKMSRRANRTPEQVAEWFVPGAGQRRVREYTTVFVETLSAIAKAPLDSRERARCYAAFLAAWLPANALPLAREFVRLPQ